MTTSAVLAEAEFDRDAIVRYHYASIAIVLAVPVVTIPLIPIALLVVWLVAPRIIRTWECRLMRRELVVKKGWLVQSETTIPLEKITDVNSVQGPLMRRFGIRRLGIETAGQTSSTGSLATLLGIRGAEDFRARILEQRDRIADREDDVTTPTGGAPSAVETGEAVRLLTEIRDTLARIEARMGDGEAG